MKVFPVVHINEVEVAATQASLALDAGADGVYLIDHRGVSEDTLFTTFNALDSRRTDSYIGINILQRGPTDAMSLIARAVQKGWLSRAPDALWSDDADEYLHTPGDAKWLKDNNKYIRTMRFLGGVAFKYTVSYTDDPLQARTEVDRLRSAVDIVTTSGKGTGHPPSVAKIRAMKDEARGPLAVASGISIENIDEYRGIVDEVLVASSVETEPYSGVFDPDKLSAFIQRAHQE